MLLGPVCVFICFPEVGTGTEQFPFLAFVSNFERLFRMFKMGKKEGVVVFVFFPQKPSRQQMPLMPIRIIHLVLVLGSLCTNKHAILIKQW